MIENNKQKQYIRLLKEADRIIRGQQKLLDKLIKLMEAKDGAT